jgi:hypothetical protein
MVAILPIGIGILAAGLIAFLAQPRLPTFSFKILKLYPTLLHDSTAAINVGAKIELHNSNFITAAVHAFTFDMYYPDWEDKLQYLGQVTDTRQKERPETSSSKKDAIWTLGPRRDFGIVDDVIMVPTNAGTKVFSSMSWDVFQKSGVLQVPLSGVFHIKANGKIPASMSMICDNNVLDAFNMEFEGISCHLDFIGPGWVNLAEESARLRSKLEGTTWRASDFPLPTPAVEEDSAAIAS